MSDKPTAPDWSTVDWSKTNLRISFELQVPPIVVSYYRRVLGRPRNDYRGVDWKSVDWNKNLQQISEELHVPVSIVRAATTLFSYEMPKTLAGAASPVLGRRGRIVTEEMIAAVDWPNTRDTMVAKQWHVSRERVRQIRQERGFPVCVINSVTTWSMEFEKWLNENRSSIEGKLAAEVHKSCPLEIERLEAFRLMKKSTIPFVWRGRRASAALHLPVNWSLPGDLINAIWNKNDAWAGINRMNYSLQQSAWDCRAHSGGIAKVLSENKDLQLAVSGEIDKAVKLGVTPRWDKLETFGVKLELWETNLKEANNT